MKGYRTYVKSSELLTTMEYEELALKVNTATKDISILGAIVKETWMNDIGELALRVKGVIATKSNDSVISNDICTEVFWYYVAECNVNCECVGSEYMALIKALKQLDYLCSVFNVEDKEILTQLIKGEG